METSTRKTNYSHMGCKESSQKQKAQERRRASNTQLRLSIRYILRYWSVKAKDFKYDNQLKNDWASINN
jgi:hypothetical protein